MHPRNLLDLTGDVKANFRRRGTASLLHILACFPGEMLRVPTVNVDLRIIQERVYELVPWQEGLSRFIYALAHHLSSDSSVRSLRIA